MTARAASRISAKMTMRAMSTAASLAAPMLHLSRPPLQAAVRQKTRKRARARTMSGEQRASPVVARVAHPRRHRPQSAGDVLDVLVEAVVLGQVQLHGDELLARIALVGDEEQPGV